MKQGKLLLACCLILLSVGCKKEEVVFTDVTPPAYAGIPTVQVNNYVNRLFIDLIGREPVDLEMEAETATLESAGLSIESREDLIDKLMFSTAFVEGDSTYNKAYFIKVYEDLKARMIEGASEGILWQQYNVFYSQSIVDSVNGNFDDMQRNRQAAERMMDVIESGEELRQGLITIGEVHRRMCYNAVYDEINMGSFNFVNASFQDLFDRFPTQSEFDSGFEIIEFNEPDVIFGQAAQNKGEYLDILVGSDEFEEGLIRWVYQGMLARDPSSYEVFSFLETNSGNLTLSATQKAVLKTDEYAGFD